MAEGGLRISQADFLLIAQAMKAQEAEHEHGPVPRKMVGIACSNTSHSILAEGFVAQLGIPGHRDRRFRMNVTGHSGSS